MECSICGVTSDAGFEIFSDQHGSLVCRMCITLMDQAGVYDNALKELPPCVRARHDRCGECGFYDAETTGSGYCHMWETCMPWDNAPCEMYFQDQWVEIETDTTWEE